MLSGSFPMVGAFNFPRMLPTRYLNNIQRLLKKLRRFNFRTIRASEKRVKSKVKSRYFTSREFDFWINYIVNYYKHKQLTERSSFYGQCFNRSLYSSGVPILINLAANFDAITT